MLVSARRKCASFRNQQFALDPMKWTLQSSMVFDALVEVSLPLCKCPVRSLCLCARLAIVRVARMRLQCARSPPPLSPPAMWRCVCVVSLANQNIMATDRLPVGITVRSVFTGTQ